MPSAIDRVIRFRNVASLAPLLISVIGFLLPLFTDIIPPLHGWAIQYTFTAISFVTFASAAMVMWTSTPIGTVDRETERVRQLSGYVTSDKEKILLEKRRLVYQDILLVLVPAVTVGFVAAVAFLDTRGFLPESAFLQYPSYLQGAFLEIELLSFVMIMIYFGALGVVILLCAALQSRSAIMLI
jgi:hypothetical protein